MLNKVLEIGRHYSITAVVTAHLPSNGHETRRILNESSSVTIFPHSASGKIKDMLRNHVGLDRKFSKCSKNKAADVLLYFVITHSYIYLKIQ